MYSVNISCYDKDSEQIIEEGGMYIHRFSGKNCCTCVLGVLGSLKCMDERELDAPLWGLLGEVQHGLCPVKLRVGGCGNRS